MFHIITMNIIICMLWGNRMLKNNILETIGDTPLVRLSRLEKVLNIKGELYAKLEYYSPGLSKIELPNT